MSREIHGNLLKAILRAISVRISSKIALKIFQRNCWQISEETHGCFFKSTLREISGGIASEENPARISEAEAVGFAQVFWNIPLRNAGAIV